MHHALWVQREAQVLGEGTLARSVKARHPHADLGHLAGLDARLVRLQELAEAGFDVFGRLVFLDLGGQAILVVGVIVNHLLDTPVNGTAGREEFADRLHFHSCPYSCPYSCPTSVER